MLRIDIPGAAPLVLEHRVLGYNGTLARDGEPLAGVADALRGLSQTLRAQVVTGDTFGRAAPGSRGCPARSPSCRPRIRAGASARMSSASGQRKPRASAMAATAA